MQWVVWRRVIRVRAMRRVSLLRLFLFVVACVVV
jgi:hypothetical protein